MRCPVEQPGSKQRVVLAKPLHKISPSWHSHANTATTLFTKPVSLICILFSLAHLFKQLTCADFDPFVYTSIQSRLLSSMDLWNHNPFVRSNLSPMRYAAACLKRHRSAVLSAGSVFTLFWLQLHAKSYTNFIICISCQFNCPYIIFINSSCWLSFYFFNF